MDKTSLQMLFGVLLGVFLLALIVMTVVYVRRKLADKREEALRDLDLMQEEAIREEQSQSKGYWINRDDIEDENQAHLLRYYHYFDNIDECIHDLIVEMYDCGFVRTEEIFVAAYGEEALTPDSFIYMTDADCRSGKGKGCTSACQMRRTRRSSMTSGAHMLKSFWTLLRYTQPMPTKI